MNTWTELIAEAGGPNAFAEIAGVSADAAKAMSSRNMVSPRHWSKIVARMPRLKGHRITWQYLASLEAGRDAKPSRFRPVSEHDTAMAATQ